MPAWIWGKPEGITAKLLFWALIGLAAYFPRDSQAFSPALMRTTRPWQHSNAWQRFTKKHFIPSCTSQNGFSRQEKQMPVSYSQSRRILHIPKLIMMEQREQDSRRGFIASAVQVVAALPTFGAPSAVGAVDPEGVNDALCLFDGNIPYGKQTFVACRPLVFCEIGPNTGLIRSHVIHLSHLSSSTGKIPAYLLGNDMIFHMNQNSIWLMIVMLRNSIIPSKTYTCIYDAWDQSNISHLESHRHPEKQICPRV